MATTRSQTGSLTIDDLDLDSLPEFWELIEGELIELSPASFKSSNLGAVFVVLLYQAGQATGMGWVTGADGGFVLFDDRKTLVAPDAAFVRRERMPDPDVAGFADLPPDFAIEVLSPSDRLSHARRKIELYLKAGVALVWLVDPKRRRITVYVQNEAPVTLTGDAELSGASVLPELRVSLSTLFPES